MITKTFFTTLIALVLATPLLAEVGDPQIRSVCLALGLLAGAGAAGAAPVSSAIKIDHFGYRPNDTKVAVFSADPGAVVEIRDLTDGLVYTIPTDPDVEATLLVGGDGLYRGAPDWTSAGITYVETDAAASESRLVVIQPDGSGRVVLHSEDAGFRMASPRWLRPVS